MRWLPQLALALASLSSPLMAHAQTLETETARLLAPGEVTVSSGYEFQTSSEGSEMALPFAFEVGLTDHLEFLVEPVPYTAIRPKAGTNATGAGDLETTLTYLALGTRQSSSALALAAEAKFPTAHNARIGTGKTDYTFYVLGSTTHGRFSTHADVGYTILGKPAGVQVSNIFDFALAEELRLTVRSHLFGEILANTTSGGGEGDAVPVDPTKPVIAELAGGEVVGTLGIAHTLVPGLEVSLSVSYDNNQAILFRPGFTYRLH